MIPQRLTLKNFLSYREAALDFQGLHTACICGANGAGKSSLLEAIAWAIWGESRAASEDDVIHIGARETQVDFIFTSHQHVYRIIRSRQRGQATALEFQIAQGGRGAGDRGQGTGDRDRDSSLLTAHSSLRFRSLTAKGIRATQQRILEHLKLDYETFVNSAYLRQGRADEFMLKRPSDRKQILADLLKLERYDELAERAKDQARQFKGQIELLERHSESIRQQLQQREQLIQEQQELEAGLSEAQQQQEADQEQLQNLQALQQQRQTWQQQLTWQQQQQRTLEQDCQRLQQELMSAHHQLQDLEALLQQEGTIVTNYAHFQALQGQEESLSEKFKTYQLAQSQRQQYQQRQAEVISDLQGRLQQTQAQLEALLQQEVELQTTLKKSADVEAAVVELQNARAHLHHLDRLQAQASPLIQRRQQIQSQIDRSATRLGARLEELHTSLRQLQIQQERQPRLQQAVLDVGDRIETLERRRIYQQSVREKGLERRSFMERLQAHQRDYEAQLAEVEQKIQLLKQGIISESDALSPQPAEALPSLKVAESEPNGSYSSLPHSLTPSLPHSPYPPCPLCDRPLDEQHWTLVLQKQETKRQEVLEQIWMIREQLSVSEREIQVLRKEYRSLEKELNQYGSALERRGQLQEQLQFTAGIQSALQQLVAEAAEVERSLQTGDYATELQEELHLLDRTLQQLNYDEKDHALARGEADRWRWAEIRHAEVKQAQRRQAQLTQRIPELQAHLSTLQTHVEQVTSETSTHLAILDQQIAEIGYDLDRHNDLRAALRQAQVWQLRYQELGRSRQLYPQLRQRVEDMVQALQERQQHLHNTHLHVEALVNQLEQLPDCRAHIQAIEQRLQQRRSYLDEQFSQLGRLQQQQQQLDALDEQQITMQAQLQTTQRQLKIYQELAQAFGKNGIQTLMIENVLPQLEAETNQILSRLSANQLHVQFVTQRSNRRDQSRSAKSKVQPAKLIETLDILIADARGTRPYETYSGGEAFRVNFAIRLALSRLLAQRSGTALQLLIIDEGFGTQDAEGCDRLIAAINAIAPDFACILAVTHVPHFKEAFQSRIEVFKTENGSQLSLSS